MRNEERREGGGGGGGGVLASGVCSIGNECGMGNGGEVWGGGGCSVDPTTTTELQPSLFAVRVRSASGH